MISLSELSTEQRNEDSKNIDDMDTIDILRLMNKEDYSVAKKVENALPQIKQAIKLVQQSFNKNGRLFYVGAGTSGRIGVIDAVECPPTFSTPPELVQGITAGGLEVVEIAAENFEDKKEMGASDLYEKELTPADTVIGITASGRTPYVIGALEYANKIGANTVSLSNNKNSKVSEYSKVKIEILTGAEVLTGSTRLKAATGQKMVLNMITTTAMIKIGKVYENLMIDLSVKNKKLKERAINIVSQVTCSSYENVKKVLELTNYEVKPAIIMIKSGVTYKKANNYLEGGKGSVKAAINLAEKTKN